MNAEMLAVTAEDHETEGSQASGVAYATPTGVF